MSSLIATKVKENMCLVSHKLFIIRANLFPYTYLLITFMQAFVRYSFHTTIHCSPHNLFVSANLYSLDLNSCDLQTSNLS